jgi:hypothetical protein
MTEAIRVVRPNGLEIAKHPVGEPPGQRFDGTSNSIRRSWPGSVEDPRSEAEGVPSSC